jgi:hypoxanthine-DNA glycosylase
MKRAQNVFMRRSAVTHPFAPVFDRNSETLVLGTFPSVKSRELNFYYGHPQNRFWRVIAALCGESAPQTTAQKRGMLLRNRIALWDVLSSCDIDGSDDSSIRNAVPNDFSRIMENSSIDRVVCNGGKAYALLLKYCALRAETLKMPSTSPANAAWTLERLIAEWRAAFMRGCPPTTY